MYINIHVDAFTTVVDWKRQRKDNLSPVFPIISYAK